MQESRRRGGQQQGNAVTLGLWQHSVKRFRWLSPPHG